MSTFCASVQALMISTCVFGSTTQSAPPDDEPPDDEPADDEPPDDEAPDDDEPGGPSLTVLLKSSQAIIAASANPAAPTPAT